MCLKQNGAARTAAWPSAGKNSTLKRGNWDIVGNNTPVFFSVTCWVHREMSGLRKMGAVRLWDSGGTAPGLGLFGGNIRAQSSIRERLKVLQWLTRGSITNQAKQSFVRARRFQFRRAELAYGAGLGHDVLLGRF
jgi:hypothetical protein